MLAVAVLIYASAMTVANLSIAHFGPAVALVNAFALIGLDLALRDWLHFRLKPWQMLVLIAAAGAFAYAINPAAGRVAVASSAAFTAAALADWLAFASLRGSLFLRSNGSNVAGSAVDSLVFVFAAGLPLAVVPGMFIAKIGGGVVWSWLLFRPKQKVAA